MNPILNGLHIAIFADHGVNAGLLTTVVTALQREGAITKLVAARRQPIIPTSGTAEPAQEVDISTSEVDAKVFDAALVLGGAVDAAPGPAKLAAFLVDMKADDKPIAAIGDGVALCIGAGIVAGSRIAVAPEQAGAASGAGGIAADDAVAADGNLISARAAEDVDAFLARAIDAIRLKFRAGTDGTPDLSAVGLASS